jgi:hypothetical protein
MWNINKKMRGIQDSLNNLEKIPLGVGKSSLRMVVMQALDGLAPLLLPSSGNMRSYGIVDISYYFKFTDNLMND